MANTMAPCLTPLRVTRGRPVAAHAAADARGSQRHGTAYKMNRAMLLAPLGIRPAHVHRMRGEGDPSAANSARMRAST